MTAWLIGGLVGLPLSGALLAAVLLRRTSASAVHRLALAVTGLMVCGTLALLPHAGGDRIVMVEWLPGSGPMALGLGTTAIYALLATTGSAFLALLAEGWEGNEVGRLSLSRAVTLLALAAIPVGFLAEHFLARYAALELVALCIALMPLIEMGGSEGRQVAWSSYLLLRVGDAGLLLAIMMLMDASGTLQIRQALDHAASGALAKEQFGWVLGGMLLAVWVKMGGWPFHLWIRAGRLLMPASRTWLFATLMPNLGLYLLYRVTPLAALTGPLRTMAMWLGAGSMALAAFAALSARDVRVSLVHVGVAHAGLALFTAAGDLHGALWLALLATTPLRVLLCLAADTPSRRATAGLFGLGGLAAAAIGGTLVWWLKAEGPPLALFFARLGVALVAAWAVRAAWPLLLRETSRPAPVRRARWAVLAFLGAVVLTGSLAFAPLAYRLALAGGLPLLAAPTLPDIVRQTVTIPVLAVALVLVAAAGFLRRRLRPQSPEAADGIYYTLESQLVRVARSLRGAVEEGVLDQSIALATRIGMGGARIVHRFVEQEGLEGVLRWCGRTAIRLGETLRRWHTGQLRRNLLWVPISLVLALLGLLLCGT